MVFRELFFFFFLSRSLLCLCEVRIVFFLFGKLYFAIVYALFTFILCMCVNVQPRKLLLRYSICTCFDIFAQARLRAPFSSFLFHLDSFVESIVTKVRMFFGVEVCWSELLRTITVLLLQYISLNQSMRRCCLCSNNSMASF